MTHESLREIVDTVRYKPGWSFSLERLYNIDHAWPEDLLRLSINLETTNSQPPYQAVTIGHPFSVPDLYGSDFDWERWLLQRIFLVEQHEAMEAFHIGDRTPFFPEHGEGAHPYEVRKKE